MLRLALPALGLLLGAACTEYDLIDGGEVQGQPNPPDVSADAVVDRFVQTTVAAVDVLWVMDTSCSMDPFQQRLNNNFEPFMTYFLDSGLDYHIGVVSTNMDTGATTEQGRLQPAEGYLWIEPNTPNPIDVFRGMSLLGVSPTHSVEKGREAAYFALELRRTTENAGFYRDDANLAIITISDEDDYSTNAYISHEDWITWLKTEKPLEGQVTYSSIVGPQVGASTCPEATEAGDKYLDVTRRVGGIEWSICDNDWAGALELLGMQAAGLRREFFLSDVPVLDTLRVWVTDAEGAEADYSLDVDFEYLRARNSIRFLTFIPEPLSEVHVEYQVLENEL